jgi:serine/threonine protein kinase
LKRLSTNIILLNELEIGSEIGSRTYGRVCVGKWKKNKYRVALKFCQNRGKIDEFLKETNLIILLPSHPNVVQIFGVCIEETHPIIVMAYCSGGLSIVENEQTNKQTNKKIETNKQTQTHFN